MAEEESKPIYIAGLDLGQAADYTALIVVEQREIPPTTPPPKVNPLIADIEPIKLPPKPLRNYALRHLERFHLGTSYPVIVERVVALFKEPPLARSHLAVDQTGVGRPVVDMLTRARPNCVMRPITITGGSIASSSKTGLLIPKRDLVGVLQVLLQSRRLQIARSLPMAAVLLKELEMFRVKVTLATGTETFEAWRERDHDDMVLSLALACWIGERGMIPFGLL